MRSVRLLTFALLAAIMAISPAIAQTTVRFASVGGLTDAGLYLAEELGAFKAANLTVTLKRMANAPDLVTALATDQLDVGGIAITPGMFAAVQQGINIKIVGDKQSFRPGFAATRLVARAELAKGSGADTIKSLKGKTFAVSARASSSFYNIVQLLRENGMSLDDIKVAQLAYPQMLPALASGAVDAAYIIEPFLSQSVRDKVAVDIGNVGDLNKSGAAWVSVPIVYSEKFAGNKAAAQAFMTAYVKGVRAYNDALVKGVDKDRVFDIIAKRAGLDRATVETTNPAGLDPNQDISLDSLKEMQQFFIEQKLLAAPTDLAKLVDLSFAKAAVTDLGVYK